MIHSQGFSDAMEVSPVLMIPPASLKVNGAETGTQVVSVTCPPPSPLISVSTVGVAPYIDSVSSPGCWVVCNIPLYMQRNSYEENLFQIMLYTSSKAPRSLSHNNSIQFWGKYKTFSSHETNEPELDWLFCLYQKYANKKLALITLGNQRRRRDMKTFALS